MTRNKKDYNGMIYGKLTIISEAESIKNRRYVVAKCECGNTKKLLLSSILQNHSLSCGCLRKLRAKNLMKTHGMSNLRIYRIWDGIKKRCLRKHDPRYFRYGGREIPITVCDEWIGENGFENFYQWSMENGYRDDLTIDRIDNAASIGYCPTNCRWTDMTTQCYNKSNNVEIIFEDKKYNILEFSKLTGLSMRLIRGRIERGWPNEYLGLPIETKLSNYIPNYKPKTTTTISINKK